MNHRAAHELHSVRFVLSRYTTSHPFSADIALSAYRLTTTLFETLSAPDVGWLTPGWEHTKTGRKTLDDARRRYEMCVGLGMHHGATRACKRARGPLTVIALNRRFLYVANDVARKGPLVPTVDIDFVCVACVSRRRQPRLHELAVDSLHAQLDDAHARSEPLQVRCELVPCEGVLS